MAKEKTYKDERGEFIFRRKNGKVIKIYVGEDKTEDIAFGPKESANAFKRLEGNYFDGNDEKEQEKILENVGVKKGNAMTFKEADSGNVNPGYSEDLKRRTNCQTCVIAFEYRMRGYNIKAKRRENSIQENLAYDSYKYWVDENGDKPTNLLYGTKKDGYDSLYDYTRTYFYPGLSPYNYNERTKEMNERFLFTPESLYDALEKNVEMSNRYTFEFDWAGRQSGHIVNMFRDDTGVLVMYDPQSDEMYRGKDELMPYLKLLKYKKREDTYWRWNKSGSKRITEPAGFSLMRIDNLKLYSDIFGYLFEKE